MPNIKIAVAGKIATNTTPDVAIVCGNSDYTVTFDLDAEWAAETDRTARFTYIRDGRTRCKEKTFQGNTVAVPKLVGVRQVTVGLYAGDLYTTTAAAIWCKPSILCGDAVEEITPEEKAGLQAQVGDLAALETTDKSSLVAAVNEVKRTAAASGGSGETSDGNSSNSGQNGDGLTETASNLLITILRDGVYSSDQSANITALATELGVVESGGGDTPDEPEVPEVTLTSISATYSGGDVAVGTALTDLTGIVVTAHYSGGTSETVTGYTLSGTIFEGENTITVTYQGKTATFTVTGIAESTGGNNGWTDGEAYAIEWTDGYKIDNASANETFGEPVENSNMSVSDYMPCYGASALMLGSGVYSSYGVFFYDENKTLMMRIMSNLDYPSPVPLGAYYCRVQCKTTNKANATVTPVKFAELGETTAWETGKYYNLSYANDANHSLNVNTGATSTNSVWNVSDYAFCYGATTLKFMTYMNTYRSAVCFYDESKNFISGATVSPSSWEVPEGAKYFRHSCGNVDTYKNGGCVNNPWLILE